MSLEHVGRGNMSLTWVVEHVGNGTLKGSTTKIKYPLYHQPPAPPHPLSAIYPLLFTLSLLFKKFDFMHAHQDFPVIFDGQFTIFCILQTNPLPLHSLPSQTSCLCRSLQRAGCMSLTTQWNVCVCMSAHHHRLQRQSPHPLHKWREISKKEMDGKH